MNNPLLVPAPLPLFEQIKPEHIEPALAEILATHREQIEKLLQQKNFTWDNLLQPLEDMQDQLNNMWSVVRHLHAVMSTELLRQIYHRALPLLTEYATQLSQNTHLYQAIQAVATSPEFATLSKAQQKIIENKLRDFRLSGVHLDEVKKERFAAIEKRLTQLTTLFEEHILDATHAWFLHVTDSKEIAGLPQSAIAAAQFEAEQKKLSGWVFTLEMPAYLAVITFAKSRHLREQIYHAYATRASDQGPDATRWDNGPVMEEIMSLRQELAQLLNYANYAEYSLARKMAASPQQVMDFLTQLAEASYPQAVEEFAALSDFAQKTDGIKQLQAWDIAYYSEKLREQTFSISQEELRPYFSAKQSLRGLFEVTKRLFNIQIMPASAELWHKDVQFFVIKDAKEKIRGYFYVDLYSRSHKREGAWMDECRMRHIDAKKNLQLPVCFLTCNFEKPIGDKPALLTHDDVITLFHEFGHGLQHLLTTVDYADVSGINGVPWDAVELASQFMENYCWQKESLDIFATHVQNHTPLPQSLFDRLYRAKNFQSALDMMRQIIFALFDFRLHVEYCHGQKNQISKILEEIRNRWSVTPTPEFNRFQHSFGHIFSGGYAAGYYSYKWAEVLACDAFSKFQETGIFNEKTGKEFLQLFLESGGVEDPAVLFKRFRGRPPEINALLQQSGIYHSHE